MGYLAETFVVKFFFFSYCKTTILPNYISENLIIKMVNEFEICRIPANFFSFLFTFCAFLFPILCELPVWFTEGCGGDNMPFRRLIILPHGMISFFLLFIVFVCLLFFGLFPFLICLSAEKYRKQAILDLNGGFYLESYGCLEN